LSIFNGGKLTAIIFFGALWGIAEATLGYFLHLASVFVPGISGFIMFPIAFYFMKSAYDKTGKLQSVLWTASIAGGIKLFDLFLPGLTPLDSIVPVFAMLTESLAVMLFIYLYNKHRAKFPLGEAFLASVGWRGVFLLFQLIVPLPKTLFDGGAMLVLRFLFLEGIINALIIAALAKVPQPIKSFARFAEAHPSVLFALLPMAIATEIIFSLL